jgi:hypothetical protein
METQNFIQQQEQRAAENARKIEAAAREKVAQRMREADQKRQQEHAARMREEDRKRAEQARQRDKQQQEMRAKAREMAKEKAQETLKKEQEKAKEQPEKQMFGASRGPTMRPSSGDKNRDTVEMMAEMDHPGLTDAQKSALAAQGVSMGEGYKNREAKRLEEAAARESRKTPGDKLEDQMLFKAGVSYEKRQAREIERDKWRVREVEQAKNNVLMPRKEKAQEQVKAQEKTPAKAPVKASAKQFEFAKEQEEPTRGGR